MFRGSTAVLALESLYGARPGEKMLLMRPESPFHRVFIGEKTKNVKQARAAAPFTGSLNLDLLPIMKV
jgi:hypothetical protein